MKVSFIVCLLLASWTAVSYAQQSKVSSVYKILAFIPKLDSLTHEEFKNYYETQHAPFVFATLGYLPACDKPVFYKRNFMAPGQPSPYSNLDASYDVVTEFAFASKANFDNFLAAVVEHTEIGDDEANFIKRDQIKLVEVDERYTDITTYSCSASCSATVRAVPREGSSWAADGKVWQVYDLAITNTGNQQVTGVKFSLDGGVIESSWNIALSSGQWSADLFGFGKAKDSQNGFIASGGLVSASLYDVSCN